MPARSTGSAPEAAERTPGRGEASDADGVATHSLEALSEAIESGAGLPVIARAAAAALDASVALIDRSSAVLAVAAASAAEEEKLLAAAAGVGSAELRVADVVVGELRFRRRGGAEGSPPGLRMVATLLGLEVERARSPEWASDEAAGEFLGAVLARRLDGREEIEARAAELGCDLGAGGGVVIARATPHTAQAGEWRARVLTLAMRAVRTGGSGALAALTGEDGGEVAVLLPASEPGPIERAARAIEDELRRGLQGFSVTVGFSRRAEDGSQAYRAGKEALMAANVAESEGRSPLAFEATGSYRLLLSAMSEDPAELQRFYAETIAPLAAYDEQYETELVATVEAYLDNDGNVTPTAETLFTHRHTIRYRLERVRELCGHDLSSTEGREKIGLGLKAMRVLGIQPPAGPAKEGRRKAAKPRKGE